MEVPNGGGGGGGGGGGALFLFYCYSCFLFSHHVFSAPDTSLYIVHMDKSLMPMPFSSHHHWYSSILTSLMSLQDQKTLDSHTALLHHNPIYVYDNAFHGFSALLSQHQLQALNASPAFLSAYPDTYLKPHTTRSVDFLSLGSASGLWPAAHYGQDVIIGVIDTGIWPESPSFRDHGMGKIPARWKGICQPGEQFNSSMCNRKLIGARYFNQGIKAVDPNITIQMNSARDIFLHGTHVASIAAGNFVHDVSYFGYANGTARGVAPRARLAVYKVMWSATIGAADVLAGIDQAVADGVDILSISLGTGDASVNLYDNPLSIASFGARQKGIVVTFAGGNDGPNTRTIMEQGIPWSIVVAAGTVDRWFAGTLTLGNGKSITGWSLFPGKASIRNLPIVYNETFAGCDSILPEMSHDVIVVCNLSLTTNASFDIIMNNLPRSKARAAIIIGDLPSLYGNSTSFSYPAAIVNSTEGRQVIDYVSNNGAPEASIFFHQTIIGPGPRPRPRPAPAVGDTSSRGPARSYDGILKPDVLAPGILILAAIPPFPIEPTIGNTSLYSNYTLLSGTSMACPHISGVSALLKAAHPNWSPSAIQSAMMTTANPLNNAKQPIVDLAYGTPASPLAIGSGHVDPNRALDPGLVYDNTPQDFVNHVCSLNFTREQTRTLIGSRNNCSTPSPDLNYPSFVATFQPMEKGLMLRRRFQRTVTNVGNSAATYRVHVKAPSNTTIIIRPRKLVFRNKYEKLSYSLSVRFAADPEIQHRHGTITWIDHTGKYSVRSPIMVSAGAGFFV